LQDSKGYGKKNMNSGFNEDEDCLVNILEHEDTHIEV
jgi:hypothetical protein